MLVRETFRRFAQRVSVIAGSPWAFAIAALTLIVWAVTGPAFHFSDTWQLVINTGTTIVTFLMVFLIQNTQNRDSRAVHLKLDELLRGVHGARTALVDLEEMSDEELGRLKSEFHALHGKLAEQMSRADALQRQRSGASAGALEQRKRAR